MFNSLSDRIGESFKLLRGKGVLTKTDVDETVSQIRRALLDADVALPVVREFTTSVREKAYGATRSQALKPGEQVVRVVHEELVGILGGDSRELNFAQRGPTIFMLAGLQGAGKTTLAGKLGKWLREDKDKRVLLVACDLQRPGAVEQLQIVGAQAGVQVWAPEAGNGAGDPVAVARSGVDYAIEQGFSVVIVDTAGRLGIDEQMMTQARQIRDVINPHEILFVLDAMIGQDAVQTSLAFKEGVGFTGVVLSKLDGDARGGAALSVRGVTGVPVLFASTGEKLGDFERFHADRMAGRILDMGDILTLIEQTQKAFDQAEAEKMAEKMAKGQFTLDDFLSQLRQIRKLGSMKKMMTMLPGMGQMREQIENFDEKEIDRVEAIVSSMTPAERADLRLLNGSRRSRIARGSGTSVAAINSLVQRFEQAKTMMEAMSRGGAMPGIGGMGALPGMGKRAKSRQAPKGKTKKKRFGNPAKQRQWEAEQARLRQGRDTQSDLPPSGSAFGLSSQTGSRPEPISNAAHSAPMPTLDDLPDDLKRLLGH